MKSILEMTATEARQYFLKQESYANFDLPDYFDFEPLLSKVDKELEGKSIHNFYAQYVNSQGRNRPLKPHLVDGVNYRFLNSKDGRYAWRPFQLIHPALYVALVHSITEEENWQLILARFEVLQTDPKIQCQSLPKESTSKYQTDTETTIFSWWNDIEQRSLELSVHYNYVIHTDISNCYGNIYTHSIAWALHDREVAKEYRKRDELLGNAIDGMIGDMTSGQTNGIPQGSTLMDFIAEMVLGYADHLLSKKLSGLTEDFTILRYRDDYRIFTNSPVVAEEIMKHLTEVLIELGLSINVNKTLPSTDLIRSAIKPDKLYWNRQLKGHKSFQKHLLIINELSHKFPNSGSLFMAMKKFLERINTFKKELNDTKAMIGIVVNIAYRNPRVYSISTAIISRLIAKLEPAEKTKIIEAVLKKFNRLPNTGHIKIWLQRVMIKIDRSFPFDEPLCLKVNDNTVKIWNSDFLNGNIKLIITDTPIVAEAIIKEMDDIIQPKEVSAVAYDDDISLVDLEAILNLPPDEQLPVPDDRHIPDPIPEPAPFVPEPLPEPDDRIIEPIGEPEERPTPAPELIWDEEQLPEPHPFSEINDDHIPEPFPEHFDE